MKIYILHSGRDELLVREILSYLPSHIKSWVESREWAAGTDSLYSLSDREMASLYSTIKDTDDFLVILVDEELLAQPATRREFEWVLRREKELECVFVLPVFVDSKCLYNFRPVKFHDRKELTCLDQSAEEIQTFANNLKDELFAWLIYHLDSEQRKKLEVAEKGSLTEEEIRVMAREPSYEFRELLLHGLEGLPYLETQTALAKLVKGKSIESIFTYGRLSEPGRFTSLERIRRFMSSGVLSKNKQRRVIKDFLKR